MTNLPPKLSYNPSESKQWASIENDPQIEFFKSARADHSNDPFRPLFHLSPPNHVMNDPNGLCQWNGLFHIFYQYRPNSPDDAVHWGHAMSSDCVFWQDMPIALYPDQEKDCYSGQTLVERDREIAIYHGTEKGNAIATATDPLLLNWNKHPNNPVIPIVSTDPSGSPYRVFDPCIWKENGSYYSLSGTFKNGERSLDCMAVDHLFKSENLDEWDYLGPLIESGFFTEPGEDGAVPNFLPISENKHLLLFFSHKRGSQYIIGEYDRSSHNFNPDSHGRMTFGPLLLGRLHAPSATIDESGRLIAIFNVKEGNKYRGWSDIMSLPRQLSLNEDNSLKITPIKELEHLRTEHSTYPEADLTSNEEVILNGMGGKSIEIFAEIDTGTAAECGLDVFRSNDGKEKTRISFIKTKTRFNQWDTIQIDISNSSLHKDKISSPPESAPLNLDKSESLKLRIYIDRSIVEVFANDRQCLTIRTYPTLESSKNIAFFSNNGSSKLISFEKWNLQSIWPELNSQEGK